MLITTTMSRSIEPEHAKSTREATRDNGRDSKTTKNDDLERLQSTKEGELLTQDAEAAKRDWIKNAPESPRNWPLWRKWWIIGGLIFYTIIIFICNTGFVTDDAEDNFGVNTELSVMGQSMVRASPQAPHCPKPFYLLHMVPASRNARLSQSHSFTVIEPEPGRSASIQH